MLPCHCRYFHCSNFEMTFDKNVVKKDNIFESFRFATMPQNSTLWQLLTVKLLPKIPFE